VARWVRVRTTGTVAGTDARAQEIAVAVGQSRPQTSERGSTIKALGEIG
jgi:hypothetical protein